MNGKRVNLKLSVSQMKEICYTATKVGKDRNFELFPSIEAVFDYLYSALFVSNLRKCADITR